METGFLTIDGTRLEFARTGPRTGTQIVLLHEGLGCVALWRGVPQALADATGLGVFAWSRAGYGASDPSPLPRPLDYMTREAALVPRILDAAAIDRCILIGHSDGGTIAAECAGRTQDARVAGVVLVAPHFFTEPGGLASIVKARDAYDTGDLRARLAKYHAHVDCAFRGWNDAWLDPGFRDWNVTDALDGIHVPVLALQGDADVYGTLRQIEVVAERAAGPVELAVMAGAGHSPHLEQPQPFLSRVTAWMARNGGAGAQ